jgi:hypothetical protein
VLGTVHDYSGRLIQEISSPPRAAAATLAGSLLFVVPALYDQQDPGVVLAASVGGAALTLYGTLALLRAQRALSRSIWWYNESLVP